MGELLRIDEEVVTEEEFIKNLKLTNEYQRLFDTFLKNKVTVHAAKKRGLEVSDEALQAAANDFRLSFGLHRSKDTHDWLKQMEITLDDFEKFIIEQTLRNMMIQEITSDDQIAAYFKLHAPKFDTVDVHQMITDSEDKAKEIVALLEEDPDSADELAEEFCSGDTTGTSSQKMTGIRRDRLADEISAKLFSAQEGEAVGPFYMGAEAYYEVLLVIGIHTAQLNADVRQQIGEAIYEEWVQSRFQEFKIS